jgi:hypothetical protein
MPRSEESRKAFIGGYKAGWNQCYKFIQCFIPEASGEALDKIQNAMEITERNFTPRPYRDVERRSGKDAYSESTNDLPE